MKRSDDSMFKVVSELPDGPERTGESEKCSVLDTASVRLHRYRCECYGNELTVRGTVYSLYCSCDRLLEPLKARSGAADIARQLGPRAPSGSSLISPRNDDTNRTTAPAWQQVEDDGSPTHSAAQVANIITEQGCPVSDRTIIRMCKDGRIPGARQRGGPNTTWEIPSRGLRHLFRHFRLSDNVGLELA